MRSLNEEMIEQLANVVSMGSGKASKAAKALRDTFAQRAQSLTIQSTIESSDKINDQRHASTSMKI